MRFVIVRKADVNTEAGALPSHELITAMGEYNAELIRAGVMLTGEGLKPSSQGARVKFTGGKPTVIDGPFTETKELVAGFSTFQASSKEEVIEWIKRWPPIDGDGEVEIEIRPLYEDEDFGPGFTSEYRETVARAQAAAQTQPAAPAPQPLTPYLTVDDARAAIDFYGRAFGARELSRHTTPDGAKIIHAALDINGGLLMLSDDFPEMTGGQTPKVLGGSPVTLHLHLADVDTVFQRAIDAGATVTMPLADQFWGDRYGQLRDPFGHSWSLATRKKAATQEDLDRGAGQQFGKE
jgi:PhnB protein